MALGGHTKPAVGALDTQNELHSYFFFFFWPPVSCIHQLASLGHILLLKIYVESSSMHNYFIYFIYCYC